ncbi:MAG TPA: hypothetical protein VF099_11215 [Ktedonobacterales bacterium]
MMNRQSLYPPLPTDQMGSDESIPPEPANSPRVGRSLWKAWLWLTGPRSNHFGKTIAAQERLRRSRLVSTLLILLAVVMLLLTPSAFRVSGLWQAIVMMGAMGVLAALLNRVGHVTLSGLVVIAVADASVTFNIVRQQYGLTNTTVADLYLLAIAIMIAGMVLPNIYIPFVGAAQIAISLIIFYGMTPDTLLLQEIKKIDGNMSYTSVLGPILLQVCSVGIVWLYAGSVDRAILRASRAEELAEAQARINEQAQVIAGQKQRLEEGIQAIQETQSRIVRGDYSARVSLQGNELLPLAVSFNMMAERLSHVKQIEAEHKQMEGALQQVLDACKAISRGMAPAAWRQTGSVLDRIFPFLQHLYDLMTEMLHVSRLADDLRTVLQRQYDSLTQMEEQLTSGLNMARTIKERTSLTLAPPVGERVSGSLGTDALKSRVTEIQQTLIQLSILLTQQITLLEQTSRSGAQARELGSRCIHGMRILGQRLKESG